MSNDMPRSVFAPKRGGRSRFATIALLACAIVASASPATARDLPVPADKGWKHAATGIILRPTLVGLPRTGLSDSTTGEWDIMAQFTDAGEREVVSVYLFHAATPDVGIWFDRAAYAAAHRSSYGGARAVGPALPFPLPGQTVASGLRQTFVPNRGPYLSTSVAVASIGEWLVTLRLSSTTLDAAGLDGRMSAALAGIDWPSSAAGSVRAARPVTACADLLPVAKAKLTRPDMSGALLGSLFAGIATTRAVPAPDPGEDKQWCRDGEANEKFAVYHRAGVTNSYMMALGDAGRVASVTPAFAIPPAKPSGIATYLMDVDASTTVFPSFDRLPRPDQVLKLVTSGKPISRSTMNGNQNTVTINSEAVR